MIIEYVHGRFEMVAAGGHFFACIKPVFIFTKDTNY